MVGQSDILFRDIPRIMCGQFNPDLVVYIFPFGVVVGLVAKESDVGHKPHSVIKALKGVFFDNFLVLFCPACGGALCHRP